MNVKTTTMDMSRLRYLTLSYFLVEILTSVAMISTVKAIPDGSSSSWRDLASTRYVPLQVQEVGLDNLRAMNC
jgi:hypothetical protein